jgi:hypothetical protein
MTSCPVHPLAPTGGSDPERRSNAARTASITDVSGAAAQVPGQRLTDLFIIEVYDCTTSGRFWYLLNGYEKSRVQKPHCAAPVPGTAPV